MKKRVNPGGPQLSRPEHTNGKPEPTGTVLSYPSNSQNGHNPNSLHVTQRVVLYNKSERDAIDALIEYHDPSSK